MLLRWTNAAVHMAQIQYVDDIHQLDPRRVSAL
jgi:hypothetical protein